MLIPFKRITAPRIALIAALAGLALSGPAAADTTPSPLLIQGIPSAAKPLNGAAGGTGGGTFKAIANFDSDHFPNLRLAYANTLAGVSRTVVNCIGDSTDAGVNNTASVGATYANARVVAPCYTLAARLTAMGYPAISDSWFGDAGTVAHGSTLPAYYPQVTFGSGWASSCTAGSVVGGCPVINSTTTANLSTTSLTSADTAVVYYIVTAGGLGTFTTQVDSGSVSSPVSETGSTGIATTTVSLGTAGVHTLNIARASGTIYIAGVEFYNSAVKQISIRNFGWGGSTTAYWTDVSHAWSPGSQLSTSTYAANLTFINLGINDWINSSSNPVAGTVANLTTVVGSVKSAGSDVVLIDPFPSATSSVPAATQLSYTAAIIGLAPQYALNVPLMDWNLRSVSNAQAVAWKFTYGTDAYHPSIAGYADRAEWTAQLLKQVF